MLSRPKRFQVGALCYREDDGEPRVLLVTSRGSGRWIIPKGWPIDGMDAPQAAMQEAWEEAGVAEGHISDDPIGTYDYDKELKTGLPVAVETLVFPLEVEALSDDFPEAHERRRKWVSPAQAANMVDEAQLQDILRRL
nr:NUDIX hydrolase [Salinihabitans flavidus]